MTTIPLALIYWKNSLPGLVDVLVGGQGQELNERIFGHNFIKYPGGRLKRPLCILLFTKGSFELCQFIMHKCAEQLNRHFASIVQYTLRMVNPLPDLRTRNLDGSSILHQVKDGDAAGATQPGLKVLQTNADIIAQTGLSDCALRHFQ